MLRVSMTTNRRSKIAGRTLGRTMNHAGRPWAIRLPTFHGRIGLWKFRQERRQKMGAMLLLSVAIPDKSKIGASLSFSPTIRELGNICGRYSAG